MRPEDFLQGVMQQMRGGVRPANALAAFDIDLGDGRGAQLDPSLAEMAAVERKTAVDLRVDDLEVERGGDDLAVVAHLAAHLAVEGRLVEHHDDRLLVVDLVDLLAKLIVGDDADHLGVRHFKGLVAEEAAAVHGFFQAFQRVVTEQFDLLSAARLDAVPLHFLAKALPIEGQVAFGGESFKQLGREAVGLEHVGGLGGGDDAPMLRFHFGEDAFDPLQAGVKSGQEVGLFLFNYAGHGRGGFAKLGIWIFHQLGDLADQLVQERLLDAELMAVQHGAAQKPADDVALLLVAGIDVFVDGERPGAEVVGDAAQAAAVFIVRIVADAADFACRFDQRPEDVDVEVRLDALQEPRPFAPGPCRCRCSCWAAGADCSADRPRG